MKKYLIPTSIFGLVLSLGSVGAMHAQNAAPQSAAPQSDQQMQQDSSQEKHQTAGRQSFHGNDRERWQQSGAERYDLKHCIQGG